MRDLVRSEKALRFFKCGKGEYGEGDKFLGISVPNVRKVAKKFKGMGLKERFELIGSEWHEVRLLGLILVVEEVKRARKSGDFSLEKQIVDEYLKLVGVGVNNWDLVDVSARDVLGFYLTRLGKKERWMELERLIKSENLWRRRVGVVAGFAFIKSGLVDEIFEIALEVLGDEEDLIHKACGWLLRETGKSDVVKLKRFLKKNLKGMPRTMLRYSIERFEEKERKAYLSGNVIA